MGLGTGGLPLPDTDMMHYADQFSVVGLRCAYYIYHSNGKAEYYICGSHCINVVNMRLVIGEWIPSLPHPGRGDYCCVEQY